MAIDKNKTRDFIQGIDELFDQVTLNLPEEVKTFIKNNVMGEAFEEICKLVLESRPPKLFLIGRSGHGKSSVINLLANKHVAEVGDVKPTTKETISYEIIFKDTYSTWTVFDTRGIFESTHPDGTLSHDTVDLLKNDLVKHNPDVIMHVISAPEVRNLSKDMEVFREISLNIKKELNTSIPTTVVLTKVDTLGNPREWPPEKAPRKAAHIKEALDYMAQKVLRAETKSLNLNFPLLGYELSGDTYISIIPVSSLVKDLWNSETLSQFISKVLPREALLDFSQAQKRKGMLKNISSALVKRFAVIAGTVGLSPIPISDIFILTPLQLLMIALIGGLSCREFKKETAIEFLSSAGLSIGAGIGLRTLAQQLLKLVPVIGWAGSGAIVAGATYGLGKAAEAYFFSGEIKKPEEFEKEWKEIKE